MPANPRIWPSIRLSRFKQDALISSRISVIYPPRVYKSRAGIPAGKSLVAHAEHDHSHAHHHDHGAAAHSCCGGKHDHGDKPAEATLAIDPVCGMKVDPVTAKHRSSYQG